MSGPVEIVTGAENALPALLLARLHAFRDSVFGEALGWHEEVRGRDGYDALNPVYVVAKKGERVIGCLRLMPTEGPCMTHDAFRQLLDEESARRGAEVWELSRFAATADEYSAGLQCGCVNTARALIESTLSFTRGNGITRLIGVATSPTLAFAARLGLAPRVVSGTMLPPPAGDRPVAFTLDRIAPLRAP